MHAAEFVAAHFRAQFTRHSKNTLLQKQLMPCQRQFKKNAANIALWRKIHRPLRQLNEAEHALASCNEATHFPKVPHSLNPMAYYAEILSQDQATLAINAAIIWTSAISWHRRNAWLLVTQTPTLDYPFSRIGGKTEKVRSQSRIGFGQLSPQNRGELRGKFVKSDLT